MYRIDAEEHEYDDINPVMVTILSIRGSSSEIGWVSSLRIKFEPEYVNDSKDASEPTI